MWRRRVSARADGGNASPLMRATSQPHAPAQDVGVHDPVAGEAVERMAEGRRPVLLEREMADPCEPIAEQRCQPEPARIARNERGRDDEQDEAAAGEMHATAVAVRML